MHDAYTHVIKAQRKGIILLQVPFCTYISGETAEIE